jgi:small conductance mechanosensitive channel
MDILFDFLGEITWRDIITSCLRILMVLLLAWLAMKILRIFVNRLERNLIHQSQNEGEPPSESQKRIETITRLIKQGLLLALWITASMVILQELGVEVGPIIASAGVAGVALGFGAQNLVRDIIAGFFIILENQIRVGDVASINGTGGLVERINFRTTVLRDLNGTVHVFPNGTIEKLANMTNEWSAYVFDLRVAYKENTDRVVEIVREVGRQLISEQKYESMMLGEPEIFGVDMLGEAGVIIKGRLRTKPIRQWDVGREFLRRVKFAFDANGIEHAFPHRSLYFGEAGKVMDSALLEKLGVRGSRHEAEPEAQPAVPNPADCVPSSAGEGDKAFSEKEIRKVESRTRGQKRSDGLEDTTDTDNSDRLSSR